MLYRIIQTVIWYAVLGLGILDVIIGTIKIKNKVFKGENTTLYDGIKWLAVGVFFICLCWASL